MPSDRRGVALLIVLFALIGTATGVASVAMLQARQHMDRTYQADRSLLDEQAWLLAEWAASTAGDLLTRATFPTGMITPSVELLNTSVTRGEQVLELRVIAYDRLGMLPTEGSDLPTGVSVEQLTVDRLGANHGATEEYLFPKWLRDDDQQDLDPALLERVRMPVRSLPTSQSTRTPPIVINVATATDQVLAVVRDHTRDGGLIEQIETMRVGGEWSPVSRGVEIAEWSDRPVRLVSTSSEWALLVEVRVGSVSSRWWIEVTSSNGGWTPGASLRVTE